MKRSSLYPKGIVKGQIIKIKSEDGKTRYDFQYTTSMAIKRQWRFIPYVQA